MQIGLLCVYHAVCGLFGAQGLDVALRWGLLSTLLSLSLWVAPPLLKPVLGHGSAKRDWGIYLGVYGSIALVTATLRSILAPGVLGLALPPEILRSLAGSMVVTFVISLACLEALISRIRFQQTAQRRNERLHAELAESRSLLVTTDDSLRREAAEFLHGEIQSRLLMAWAYLDEARSEAARRDALAQEARKQLDTLRHEGLNHARILMGLTDRPLTEHVDELVARFGAVLPLTLRLDPAVRTREKALSPELRAAAQRMLEEGLLNAFRHASASRVTVSLEPDASGGLVLEVCDDGVGFDPGARDRGLGLSGLGSALEALGGKWSLESHPGAGTRLMLLLPLEAAAIARVA